MRHIIVSIAILFLSSYSFAHSGGDPVRELGKKRSYLLKTQKDFGKSDSHEERYENLRKQIRILESSIILLRNTLGTETAQVRSIMSKHGVDYVEEIRNSLTDMNNLLVQLEPLTEN
jgi:hypothetical protein